MTLRRMQLLVTGGAGYIGSIVAAQLIDAGHDVTVLDHLERGHQGAVPADASLARVDLLDAGATREVLAQGFDAVLHFAALALVAESVAQPELYHRGNFVGTLNLLDAMREHGCKRRAECYCKSERAQDWKIGRVEECRNLVRLKTA